MEKLKTLSVQTYVRTRTSTIVVDLVNQSSGAVELDLSKPSDVTLVMACLAYSGVPEIFVAAIDRTPTLMDFDVIMSPTDQQLVKNQGRVTLHLPEGEHELRWVSCSTAGTPQIFGEPGSRLALAIDQ